MVSIPQGQPSHGTVSAQYIATCTSTSPLCCSVRAVTPSLAGTASSMPIRTTSEYWECWWVLLVLPMFSTQLSFVCSQIPVPGRCSEEPAQAPGLAGEAPRGQACNAAEEYQGGSQLVSVEARTTVGCRPGGASS